MGALPGLVRQLRTWTIGDVHEIPAKKVPVMVTQTTSAFIAIASVVAYQVSMKSIPHDLNPISALVTFYLTALICTVIAAKFVPVSTPNWSIAEFSWAAVIVGIAIVGIELGFLLMYRSGWHLSVAPLVTIGGATVLLAPIAMLIFKQPFSARYFVGLVLCLYGLYLLAPQEQ
ncbi:MAG: multidrug transporter EmrE-like cation transporter [Woeseiaceae bacterium]|jgi:multidrug transporter EmrE-like cation transporter